MSFVHDYCPKGGGESCLLAKRRRCGLQRFFRVERSVLSLVGRDGPEEKERHRHALALQERKGLVLSHILNYST